MEKITVIVEGMSCPMCEAHINDAVRRAFPVRSVKSDRKKGQTVILTKSPIEKNDLVKAIAGSGYTVAGVTVEPYEKKSWFFGKKK